MKTKSLLILAATTIGATILGACSYVSNLKKHNKMLQYRISELQEIKDEDMKCFASSYGYVDVSQLREVEYANEILSDENEHLKNERKDLVARIMETGDNELITKILKDFYKV